jgi:alkylhydroperoxidase/carboxymuconolactone decarboxylase family protein YurZ
MKTLTPFNADFQDLITRYAWDDIWNRPGMDHPTRRKLVISMLVALGHWEEFKLHTGAALRTGDLSEDDIREILMTAAIYCGVPAANHAFKEARTVIDSLGGAAKKKKR